MARTTRKKNYKYWTKENKSNRKVSLKRYRKGNKLKVKKMINGDCDEILFSKPPKTQGRMTW